MSRSTVTPEETDAGGYIAIMAEVGQGPLGDIALDDITVTFGECMNDTTTVSADDDDVITEAAAAADDDDDDVVAVNVNDVAADVAAGDSDNVIDDADANDDTETADGNK